MDWAAIGAGPPTRLALPAEGLPRADVVVITWASAEWAAVEQVFLRSHQAFPASAAKTREWNEWRQYDDDMPPYHDPGGQDWSYWGWFTLVEVGGRRVLLFKSNTHLVWPGEQYLVDLIQRLVDVVQPALLLSIGTAGGARITDHVGAVQVVNAGALYDASAPPSAWPVYRSTFQPSWDVIGRPGFGDLLVRIPVTEANLQELAAQYNRYGGTSYTLEQLDPLGLSIPTPQPSLSDLTAQSVPLLTTSTFVVGTTDGRFDSFACMEMDDALIGKVCGAAGTDFGFVRNLSNPVQNAALPSEVQGDWGGAVYATFGMYTSYNGAVATWAILDGGHG